MNPLALLRLVPTRAWIFIAALAYGAVLHHRATAAGERAVKAERELRELQASAAQAAIQRVARVAGAQQEVIHAVQVQAERDRAAASAASAAVRGVLDTQARAGRTACAAAAQGGPAASAAAVVPAELLRRALETAGELAATADERRTAGHACERAYEVLTQP